jgi:hypothetical protein
MQATRATAAHRMQAMRATAAHRMQAVRAVWSARRARGKRCSLSLLALLVQKYKYLRSSLEREEGAWEEVYSQFTCFTGTKVQIPNASSASSLEREKGA